jgi:hypothetical protein
MAEVAMLWLDFVSLLATSQDIVYIEFLPLEGSWRGWPLKEHSL